MTKPSKLIIYIPPGVELLNANQRMHYHEKARITKDLRAHGRSAFHGCPRYELVHIVAYICPSSKRRCDPANWYPSIKAIIDGAVDAGLIPDDSAEHLDGPDMRLGPIRFDKLHQIVLVAMPLAEHKRVFDRAFAAAFGEP